jgi:hypothetical protein
MASYIIKKGELIAKLSVERKSGELVRFSDVTCEEKINAAREFNLVNAQTGRISNAANWNHIYRKSEGVEIATEINPGEYKL